MPTEPKTVPGNPAGQPAKAADSRQERLAQALRDNLKKRKVQQRERKEGQRGRQDGQGGGAQPCVPTGKGDDSTR